MNDAAPELWLDQLPIGQLLALEPHLIYANVSVFSTKRLDAGPLCAESHGFHYVLYGRGRIEIGKHLQAVTAGMLIGVPWGTHMHYYSDEHDPLTMLGMHLYFGPALPELQMRGIRHRQREDQVDAAHPGRLRGVPERIFLQDVGRGGALERTWLEMAEEFSLDRPGREIALDAQLRLVLLEIVRRQEPVTAYLDPHEQMVQSIKQFIRANPAHPHRRKELGLIFDVSPGYLATIFQRIAGIGLQAFIIQTRLEYARDLLIARKCNVKESALAAGFHDGRHLLRTFVKHYGCTPKQYQARHWKAG